MFFSFSFLPPLPVKPEYQSIPPLAEEAPRSVVVQGGGGGGGGGGGERFSVAAPQPDNAAEEETADLPFSLRQYSRADLRHWSPSRFEERTDIHPGQNGAGASPPESPDTKERFHEHEFNIVASELVPLNRSLKDYRDGACANKPRPSMLPATSVIIVFHNEAWSTLLRTVHSVINRSPRELLVLLG